MTFGLIIALTISIINLFLGLSVYLNDRRATLNRLFLLFIISVTIWSSTNFLEEITNNKTLISILWRIDFGSALLVGLSFLFFSYYFPFKNRKSSRKLLAAISIIVFLTIIVSISTNLVVKEIQYYSNGIKFINGELFIFYEFIIFILFGHSIFNLLKKIRISQGETKKQIIYILIGFLISTAIALVTNLIIPRFLQTPTSISKFGVYSIIFFTVFTAYAITKHHLFNIKVIATEILTALMAIMLLVRIPLSKTTDELMFNLLYFHIFLVLGILLIRTVWLEIHRIEEIEKLNKEKLAAYDKIKKQADELKLANIDLQKLLEMKTEFMRVASHQLRTPTSSIMGMLSMLAEGSVPPEKRDGFIKMAYEASEKLSIIIRNVLSATSLDSGRLELSFQKADLKDIIHKAVNECKKLALQKKLALRVNMPENLPLITADTHWLKQVFNNLIDNAVFYTPKGEITIDVKDNLNNITATIQDSGVGISVEDKDRLFKKFTRGQHAQQVHPDGSGLGLYIAKSIIDLHHGMINIQSDGQGKGAAVEVVLPK